MGTKDIDDLTTNKHLLKKLNECNRTSNVLADSAYDTVALKEKITSANLKHTIKSNNRNTKNKKKLRKKKLTKADKRRYLKRQKVEHLFGIIKRYAKINCVYERKMDSFNGLVLLVFGSILINRSNNTLTRLATLGSFRFAQLATLAPPAFISEKQSRRRERSELSEAKGAERSEAS